MLARNPLHCPLSPHISTSHPSHTSYPDQISIFPTPPLQIILVLVHANLHFIVHHALPYWNPVMFKSWTGLLSVSFPFYYFACLCRFFFMRACLIFYVQKMKRLYPISTQCPPRCSSPYEQECTIVHCTASRDCDDALVQTAK